MNPLLVVQLPPGVCLGEGCDWHFFASGNELGEPVINEKYSPGLDWMLFYISPTHTVLLDFSPSLFSESILYYIFVRICLIQDLFFKGNLSAMSYKSGNRKSSY